MRTRVGYPGLKPRLVPGKRSLNHPERAVVSRYLAGRERTARNRVAGLVACGTFFLLALVLPDHDRLTSKGIIFAAVAVGLGLLARRFGPKMQNIDGGKVRGDA